MDIMTMEDELYFSSDEEEEQRQQLHYLPVTIHKAATPAEMYVPWQPVCCDLTCFCANMFLSVQYNYNKHACAKYKVVTLWVTMVARQSSFPCMCNL